MIDSRSMNGLPSVGRQQRRGRRRTHGSLSGNGSGSGSGSVFGVRVGRKWKWKLSTRHLIMLLVFASFTAMIAFNILDAHEQYNSTGIEYKNSAIDSFRGSSRRADLGSSSAHQTVDNMGSESSSKSEYTGGLDYEHDEAPHHSSTGTGTGTGTGAGAGTGTGTGTGAGAGTGAGTGAGDHHTLDSPDLLELFQEMQIRIQQRQNSCKRQSNTNTNTNNNNQNNQNNHLEEPLLKELPILQDLINLQQKQKQHLRHLRHSQTNRNSTSTYTDYYCQNCAVPSSQIQFIDEYNHNYNHTNQPCSSSHHHNNNKNNKHTFKFNYTDDGYAVIISFTPKESNLSPSSSTSSSSSSSSPFRNLFINLLSLQTYQHAKHIIILYYGHDIEHLINDKLYGKRIWDWHLHTMNTARTNDDHPKHDAADAPHNQSSTQKQSQIQIITQQDIHGSSTHHPHDVFHHILFPFHPMLLQYFQQQTILYLHQNDNDRYHHSDKLLIQQGAYVGGEQTFLAGYELSKLNHDTLVALNVDLFNTSIYTRTTMNSSTSGAFVKDQGENDESLFITQCPQEYNSTSSSTTTTTTSSSITSIINLSGTFISRKYFSLMWNPIFENYRSFVQNKYNNKHIPMGSNNNPDKEADLEENTMIGVHERKLFIQSISVSSIVSQLSNRLPLLYPLIRQTWSKNIHYDILQGTRKTNNFQSSKRRLAVEIIDVDGKFTKQYLPPKNRGHSHHHHRRRRKNWELDYSNVNFEEDERRHLLEEIYVDNYLPQQTSKIESNEELLLLSQAGFDFIKDNRAYFGSYPSSFICWCDKTTKCTRMFSQDNRPMSIENMKNQMGCKSQCNGKHDDLVISQLPWMTKTNITCES